MIQGQSGAGFHRVELIDHRKSGTKIVDLSANRSFIAYGDNMEAMIAVQDEGQTLKIFLA